MINPTLVDMYLNWCIHIHIIFPTKLKDPLFDSLLKFPTKLKDPLFDSLLKIYIDQNKNKVYKLIPTKK